MTLEITQNSHVDHGLTPEHVAFIVARFAGRDAFFLETFTLPDSLAELECGLYGPLVGDGAVDEGDVSYVVRGARKCASRVVAKPARKTRTVTVIAGPSGDRPCVLYTSYGGPAAPREPGDATIPTWEALTEARAFWADHALAVKL